MTEQQFKKKLIIRIILCTAIFVVGLVLFLCTITRHSLYIYADQKTKYIDGILAGFTIGGFIKTILLFVTLKNQKLFKRRFIMENDERNKQIALKSWAWAGYGTVFALLISTIFIPITIMWYVYIMMCVPLVIFALTYKILHGIY